VGAWQGFAETVVSVFFGLNTQSFYLFSVLYWVTLFLILYALVPVI